MFGVLFILMYLGGGGELNLTRRPFSRPGWRLFDDSTVTTVEESQVVTRYAYVLFYRRRNSPVERPPRFLGPLGVESPTAAGATASQVRAPFSTSESIP